MAGGPGPAGRIAAVECGPAVFCVRIAVTVFCRLLTLVTGPRRYPTIYATALMTRPMSEKEVK